MKTRHGFVSNSSSSSFIVLLHHKPESLTDLKNMLFPEWSGEELIKYEYNENIAMTVNDIVARVYTDICNGQGDRYNCDTIEIALSGYIEEIYNYGTIKLLRDIYNKKSEEASEIFRLLNEKYGEDDDNNEPYWKKWEKDEMYPEYLKRKEEAQKAEKEYLDEKDFRCRALYVNFRNKYPYHKFEAVLEYGDRNGEAILENEDVFRNVPHLIASNH